jgi:hypothetical protein
MTIDINRRLLISHGYMNILNTITQLNEQLPLYMINEVRKKNYFYFYFNHQFSKC